MPALRVHTLTLVALLAACASANTQPIARARAAPTGPTQCAQGEVLVSSSVLSGVAPSDAPTVNNECLDEAQYQQRATASMYTCRRNGASATCLALPPSAGR